MKYFSDERIHELMDTNKRVVVDTALDIVNAFYGFYEYTNAFADEENHNDLKYFEQVMNGLLCEDVEKGELGKGLEMLFYDEDTSQYYAIACEDIVIKEIKKLSDDMWGRISITPSYSITASVGLVFLGAVDVDEQTELYMGTQQMIASDIIEMMQESGCDVPIQKFMSREEGNHCRGNRVLSKKDLCIQLNIMKIMGLSSQLAYDTLLCSDDRIWMNTGNDDAIVYNYEQLPFSLFMNNILDKCTYSMTYEERGWKKTVIAKLQFALPFKQLTTDDRASLNMLEREISSKIPTKGAFLCGFDDEPKIIPQMFVTVEYY